MPSAREPDWCVSATLGSPPSPAMTVTDCGIPNSSCKESIIACFPCSKFEARMPYRTGL